MYHKVIPPERTSGTNAGEPVSVVGALLLPEPEDDEVVSPRPDAGVGAF
jgi:hypothetical protein